MKKIINYTCRHCGATNVIIGFWQWFFTPHFGSKKYMKCSVCGKYHAMERKNYRYKWLDLY